MFDGVGGFGVLHHSRNPLVIPVGAGVTLPSALWLFIDRATRSAFGPMFAMSVLELLPVGPFSSAFQRLLVDGAATCGING
ncbi:hypothetical protein [Saccharothrix saharensis]|uniref:hypothetical protein n=1 Tax=Saccharothrix saharensis TaxID=571190 RepID=UPI001B870CF3|nr:hypothetical protein [Saccharothrix saharensis]